MATTAARFGDNGSSNMRPEYDHVNSDCKRQEFWRNREVGWSSTTFARLTQRGVLTPKEAVALLLGLERGDFTPGQILEAAIPVDETGKPIEGAKLATNKNAISSLLRKFGEKGLGIIKTKQKPNHNRHLPGIYEPTHELFSRFQIPIRAYKKLKVCTQSSFVPEQYVQSPAPPEAPNKKVGMPRPKVQKEKGRSAPAACSGLGNKDSNGKKYGPEIEAMAQRIEALSGTIKIEEEVLRGMLRKHATTELDIDQAIADVQAVLPTRRRTKPDTDGRQLVIRYLSMEPVRLGVADQAAKIRAQETRETAAATSGIPTAEAAEMLATKFGIGAKNFAEKILPEVLENLGKAAMLVSEGWQINLNLRGQMRSRQAFAFRSMTIPSEWAKIKNSQRVERVIAERSEALQRVIREGHLRCGISEIPKDAVWLLEEWAVLASDPVSPHSPGISAYQDELRDARIALLLRCKEAFGPEELAAIHDEARKSLSASGLVEGSKVWGWNWNSRIRELIDEINPWISPARYEEAVVRTHKILLQQLKTEEDRAKVADRWNVLQATVDELPAGEREYVKLCLGLRQAMGATTYFWTEVVSHAEFRGVQGNSICLGVRGNAWRGALMLENSLSGFLPEAQTYAGLKMSIVFERILDEPQIPLATATDGGDRWSALQTCVDALPEGEREFTKLCLGLRQAMGAESYFWTEVVSSAVFRGVQGNNICLGVKSQSWLAAQVLAECLPGFLPEAQAHSDVKLSIVFEEIADEPQIAA